MYSYHGFAIFHDERYVKTGSRSACFIQNPKPLVTLPPLRVPLLWQADFRNWEAALRAALWRLVLNLARAFPNLGSGMFCFQEGNHPVPTLNWPIETNRSFLDAIMRLHRKMLNTKYTNFCFGTFWDNFGWILNSCCLLLWQHLCCQCSGPQAEATVVWEGHWPAQSRQSHWCTHVLYGSLEVMLGSIAGVLYKLKGKWLRISRNKTLSWIQPRSFVCSTSEIPHSDIFAPYG